VQSIYILCVPTKVYIYIKILNYITNSATCFGASAPFSGSFDIVCYFYNGKGKGKAIPLQTWTGPVVSRRMRLPDFKTIGT
jgi:hypothetical protein